MPRRTRERRAQSAPSSAEMLYRRRRQNIKSKKEIGKSEYGKEEDEGNVEHKLSVHRASVERIKTLVTQLLFRLNEGHGHAVYRVGVSDDGRAEGLARCELVSSLRTLREMAESLGAGIARCKLGTGSRPLSNTAEVYVDANWSDEGEFGEWLNAIVHQGYSVLPEFIATGRKNSTCPVSARLTLPDDVNKEEIGASPPLVRRRFLSEGNMQDEDCHQPIRVAVIGSEESGKTTLIGVLATGRFDDGCGLARTSILRHCHEIQADGTTSDIAQVAACGVVLLDLAGHKKYLKTTICGLTSRAPDIALLVVDVTDKQTRRMTLEHLGVAIALRLPVIVVLTHADLLPWNDTGKDNAERLKKLLARNCTYDSDDIDLSSIKNNKLFLVSSVTGAGYPELISTLQHLRRRPRIPSSSVSSDSDDENTVIKNIPIVKSLSRPNSTQQLEIKQPLVRIHDARHVEYVGTVLEGTVTGPVAAGQRALLGPVFGQWHQVIIRSIRLSPTGQTAASIAGNGQSASFALATNCTHFEQVLRNGRICFTQEGGKKRRRAAGTVLLAADTLSPPVTLQFTAELLVLCAPRRRGALGTHFESVVHACTVRQSAKILHIHGTTQELVAGTKAICTLRFLFFPEFLMPGTTIILRDGQTRAVGTVIHCEEARLSTPTSSVNDAVGGDIFKLQNNKVRAINCSSVSSTTTTASIDQQKQEGPPPSTTPLRVY
mmetsp:Transcript_20805/g.26926  ORF Transcript_20805/g.26926 Transcript_20805/m.26926 type:complete len:717 (+) Transcript_20805:119-2269(+)